MQRELNLKRIVISIGGAVIISASALHAMAGIAQTKNPALDTGFNPWRGVAPAVAADRLIANYGDQVDIAAVGALARASLMSQPVNPRALRLSGIVAEAQAQPGRASRLMHLSNAASRRDMGTQVWLINEAARTGNAAAALEHYDIAMRANDRVSQLLFPVLTSALEQPELARRFVPYIRADAVWVAPFLNYAFANTKRPEVFADIMVRAGGFPKTAPHNGQEQALITQLVVQKHFAKARQTFATWHPDRTYLFRSLTFDPLNNAATSGMFGWQTSDSPSYGATLVQGEGSRTTELEVFANAGARAIVAGKLLFLPPGRYAFQPSYGNAVMAAGSAAIWQVQCVAGAVATTVWESAGSAPAPDTKPPPAAVTVPGGCDAVYVNLVVAGGTSQTGSELTVRSVSLAARDSP